MAKRGRKPLESLDGVKNFKFIKRNYYIEERYTKSLTVLSALTGKELSLLVNEAIFGLINKYQPKTDIDLLKLENIQKEN